MQSRTKHLANKSRAIDLGARFSLEIHNVHVQSTPIILNCGHKTRTISNFIIQHRKAFEKLA